MVLPLFHTTAEGADSRLLPPLHSKFLLHPCVCVTDVDANSSQTDLDVGKALRDQIVDRSDRESPTRSIASFIGDRRRWVGGDLR
jgi:hypothetical protein